MDLNVRVSIYVGTSGVAKKRQPPKGKFRRRLLDEQNDRCAYCRIPFGTAVLRKARIIILRLNWDHFRPYAYVGANPDGNWVAACQICNGIKYARIFPDFWTAREVILRDREQRGYEPITEVLARAGGLGYDAFLTWHERAARKAAGAHGEREVQP